MIDFIKKQFTISCFIKGIILDYKTSPNSWYGNTILMRRYGSYPSIQFETSIFFNIPIIEGYNMGLLERIKIKFIMWELEKRNNEEDIRAKVDKLRESKEFFEEKGCPSGISITKE